MIADTDVPNVAPREDPAVAQPHPLDVESPGAAPFEASLDSASLPASPSVPPDFGIVTKSPSRSKSTGAPFQVTIVAPGA